MLALRFLASQWRCEQAARVRQNAKQVCGQPLEQKGHPKALSARRRHDLYEYQD